VLPDKEVPGCPITGRSAPRLAVGAKTSQHAFCVLMDEVRTGAGSRRLPCAPARSPPEVAERLRRIRGRSGTAASRWPAASATPNAPIARAEPFSVCTSAPASAGQRGEAADQAGPPGPQTLSAPRARAWRRQGVMRWRWSMSIGPVVGSERRRWHPGNPFQIKRHAINPIPPPVRSVRQRSFR